MFDDASGLTLVERLKADQDKSTLETQREERHLVDRDGGTLRLER